MRKAPRRRPCVERLDERFLPAVTGLPWPDPGRITLSFAPDGADVGGTPNRLSAALDASSAASWRTTVLRAFQSWAASAGVDVAVVGDDGRPLGSPGPLQGDPGVGDVRVAARPLADGTLALGHPFDLLDAWSGDVLLNSDARYGDGTAGTQDLFGAVLHEAGHVFGLDENPADPASAMYPRLVPGRKGPSADDVAQLVALYGPRKTGSSGSSLGVLPYLSQPSDLSGAGLFGRAAPAADGEVSGPADRDTYVIIVPATASGTFSVNVRASGVSLLTGKLTVFDPLGQVVGQAVATDPLKNDLSVAVPAGLRGGVLFAQVESAGPRSRGLRRGRLPDRREAPALAAAAAALTRAPSTTSARTTGPPASPI
ncbi:MAG: hypothetical protein U0835_24880 [Isosphaeraceae bacterium]